MAQAKRQRALKQPQRNLRALRVSGSTQEPDPIELMARGLFAEAALFLLPYWAAATKRGARARMMQQASQMVEIDRHVRQARLLRSQSPDAEVAAITQVISDDCARAGHKCPFQTVRSQLLTHRRNWDDATLSG